MKLNNNELQASGGLPDGWRVATLGEVLPLTYGKALKKDIRDESGKVPVYGSSGPVGVHSSALTKKPALIVGRKGSVGEVYRSTVPCWPIDTVYFAEQREDSDIKFFEYLLKGLKLNRLDKSTAVPGLSRDDYNAVEVAIAPLDQQRSIVAEIEKQFSRLDEAVANLKRVKANLKRYKAAVLKAAVEGRLVETEAELARSEGRSYETGAQLLQRILETRRSQWKGKGKYKEPPAPDTTDLPELPEGWVWSFVSGLGDVVGGLTKNPKRSKLTKKLPYLRVANVYANELRLDEIEEIGVDDSELEKLLVLKGDLLIVEGNGSPDQIGRLAIWDGSIAPCVHQNHLIKVRLAVDCLPDWVVGWLMSIGGRTYIREIASSTSGLYTLSVGKVGGLPVPLPPVAEQQRIVTEVERCLSILRETEVQIEANLKRAERLRQSVLSDAFSGKLSRQEASLGVAT